MARITKAKSAQRRRRQREAEARRLQGSSPAEPMAQAVSAGLRLAGQQGGCGDNPLDELAAAAEQEQQGGGSSSRWVEAEAHRRLAALQAELRQAQQEAAAGRQAHALAAALFQQLQQSKAAEKTLVSHNAALLGQIAHLQQELVAAHLHMHLLRSTLPPTS